MLDPREKELQIPPAVHGDPNPRELLRAWAAHKQLHVIFNPLELWDDPASWGMFLVDIARHAARAYEQEGVCSAKVALEKIRDGFDAEWGAPTDIGTTEPTR